MQNIFFFVFCFSFTTLCFGALKNFLSMRQQFGSLGAWLEAARRKERKTEYLISTEESQSCVVRFHADIRLINMGKYRAIIRQLDTNMKIKSLLGLLLFQVTILINNVLIIFFLSKTVFPFIHLTTKWLLHVRTHCSVRYHVDSIKNKNTLHCYGRSNVRVSLNFLSALLLWEFLTYMSTNGLSFTLLSCFFIPNLFTFLCV